MTISSLLLLSFLGLAALILLVAIALRRFGIKYYSIAFGVGHFLFIIVMSCIYYFGSRDAQHQLFWILPGTVDLPISELIQILSLHSMIIFVMLLATLGSLQYAAVGWCIDFKLSKDRKSLLPSKHVIVASGLLLIGLAYWTYTNVSYLRLNDYEKSEIELKNAKTEVDRFRILVEAAKSSFKFKKYDKARNYAEELLTLDQKYKNEIISGNVIYDSHIVLGRLELLNGKPEQAIYHLSEAVKTSGDSALATFGPDMSLAKELLEKGYKKPVIEFLTSCKRFWTYDEGKLETWIKEINEGKIPDLGMNLFY